MFPTDSYQRAPLELRILTALLWLLFEDMKEAKTQQEAPAELESLIDEAYTKFAEPNPRRRSSADAAVIATLKKRLSPHCGTFWDRVVRQFKFSNRRGVLLAGPRAAGKTTLRNALRGKNVGSSTVATTKTVYRYTGLGRRVVRLIDTVGDSIQMYNDVSRSAEAALEAKRPDILTLVFAPKHYERGGERVQALEETWRENFLRNIASPRLENRVERVLVLINKADIVNLEEARESYLSDEFQSFMARICEKVSKSSDWLLIPTAARVEADVMGQGKNNASNSPCNEQVLSTQCAYSLHCLKLLWTLIIEKTKEEKAK